MSVSEKEKKHSHVIRFSEPKHHPKAEQTAVTEHETGDPEDHPHWLLSK